MSADLSLVLVTYRSSAVAPAAVVSFRAEVAALGVSGEVVIVDHSEDGVEEARLRALAPNRLLALPNRGYAAGVNAGVAAASGRTLLVGNPDITFTPGSVGRLVAAFDQGWDVVGPQFGLAGLSFPPADLQTLGEQLGRWLASRSKVWWNLQLRRELARWRSVWDATGPVPVPTLSGALLAFRREAFARVGPWDEGYFLYFEETDWLRRATAAGLRLAQSPSARVEHAWGHAAPPVATAPHFERSRRRYFAANFGWRGRIAAGMGGAAAPMAVPEATAGGRELPGGSRLWLVSPVPLGLPAAGFRGSGAGALAAARALVHAVGRAQRFFLTATGEDGLGPVGSWRWGPGDE